MRYLVGIFALKEKPDDLTSTEFDMENPVYGQHFEDLDVSKLILFLNQKRRVRRKKEVKGE